MAYRSWPEHFSSKVVRDAFGSKLCSYTISLEAWRRGLEVTVLDAEFNRYRIESKGRSMVFNRSKCSLTTNEAITAIKNKQKARELMLESGVAVPLGKSFSSALGVEPLLKYVGEIGFPVVIKPLDGTLGRGVFTNLKSKGEIVDAYNYVVDQLNVKEVVVEQHVLGEDYRVFVVGGEVAGAVKRVPANVVGDGEHTVDELIGIKNNDRKKNPFLSKGLIRKDREVFMKIKEAGYELTSVLGKGERLFLRGKANASAGGDVIDATESLPGTVKQSAIKAISSIPGLEYCGVDVLYDMKTGGHAVIEMNSRAQIGVNMYPSDGQGRDIPRAIIDYYYPDAPLTHDQIDKKLIFDISSVLAPIASGVARSVTLASSKKKNNGDLIRRCYVLHASKGFSLKRNRMLKLARELKVDGFLKKGKMDEFTLVVSGSRKSVDGFFDEFCEILGFCHVKSSGWSGVIPQGFRFFI
ncbi:ATP-grasp domain-containing protein [Halomonas sp. 328]|uniref:hypothetical protein n=1 Tax=Halomonas sp. 328 TaxID=2776704 RepID=UPI0018A74834|nr:hypothetical protein [Halomonas sp. 328]MBF8223900.1 hypothetical protein [Halomonas sp. 328]